MLLKLKKMVDNYEQWKVQYKLDKRAIWIRVALSDNSEYYFKYKEYDDWYLVQAICSNKKLTIKSVRIQYRSNFKEHEFGKNDGVYLIRSLIGKPGMDSIETLTLGEVYLNTKEVHKTVYSLPDLTVKDKTLSTVEDCFSEAMILWN